MKEFNIRAAELRDAENLRQLFQMSIRRLCASHHTPEQIQRWTDRPVEAFQGDIQNSLVVVMEFQGKIMGFAQMVRATGEILAVYVHPGHARQNIGSFLIMWLQVGAYDDDLARLTVNAPLNAVEFFRSREFIEVGPGSIALDDGTCLPAVKMEHLVSQPLVFAGDQSLADRVISSLACDGAGSRAKALRALKAQSLEEALDAIVSLLNHPEEKIRRRAGGALTLFSKLHGEPVNVEQKADALAHYLEHGEDPRVRLSCALALGPVHSPNADRAFLRALADPFDKVVQWACREVGERCGAEGTGAIKGLLNHSSWHVRLIACITLIQQKAADQRVVATLEALSREPEAAEHDAFEDECGGLKKNFVLACGGKESELKEWGKLASLLEKSREIASRAGSERTTRQA